MVRGGWWGGGSPLCQKTTRATWEGPFLVLFPPPPPTPGQFRAPSVERKPSVPSVGDGAGLRKQEHREAQGNRVSSHGEGRHTARGWAPRGAGRGSYQWREDPGLERDPGSRRADFRGVVTINALGHFSSRDSQILISTAQHPRVQMHRKFPQQSDHPAHDTGTAHLQP